MSAAPVVRIASVLRAPLVARYSKQPADRNAPSPRKATLIAETKTLGVSVSRMQQVQPANTTSTACLDAEIDAPGVANN